MNEKIKICITSFIALLCCGILSYGMTKIIHTERTVSVRGLAEKEVDADMAVWKLSFSVGENDLGALQQEIIKNKDKTIDFLKQNGLDDSDFSVMAPEITDTTVNIYLDSNRRSFNYIGKQSILVRSAKVPCVKNAADNTLDLVGKGVSVNSDYDNRVQYYFNGLNEIKPEMIADATENARKAAEQFAHDSGSKVGKIKTASQGLFSIEDAAPGLEYKKNVRVVTTVVYNLVD